MTIHFCYFNDECEDVLDFLVILTCNDTLMLNPFDFQIPASSLGGTIAPIDHGIMDNLWYPSFVTIGKINTRFEGYGAA